MKKFNTTGPCFPDEHYMLPALDRLPGIREFVAGGNYFVIHAPRQTGKTTALKALVREINEKGDMFAVYCTLETLQNRSDPEKTNIAIRDLIADNVEMSPFFVPVANAPALRSDRGGVGLAVRTVLQNACRASGKSVVVFFDETDCLVGDALISFLRQLRDGYVNRKEIPFPKSVALVGMLDVRDYKAQIRSDGESLGQISPFNIIAEDMLIPNFVESDIRTLYAQHTAETGQAFADGVVEDVWRLTRGQPWLVNAIAHECVAKIHAFRYAEPITVADVESAKEEIIRRRDTHVDSLMERMREPRVRRIVEPLISGQGLVVSRNSEDFRYVIDLGLLREDEIKRVVPANPMYSEIIGRYLTRDEQDDMLSSIPETPWVKDDGLDMAGLMAAFQRFWRENSGADRDIMGYREAVPHLVLMAFLQRVTNGGGHINREMALGQGRLDLCVEFRGARYAIEVKTSANFTGEKSYEQCAKYLDDLGLTEGWMPIFDKSKTKTWDEKIYTRDETFNGKTIHVIGL
ncbi:MAG: ATP-binding protein [Kiritimatiellae bacterium]|nr:ATP-binding protein [Kiritimatiellia bacterium]